MVGLVTAAAEPVIEGPAGFHSVAIPTVVAFLLAAEEDSTACEAEEEERLRQQPRQLHRTRSTIKL